jgi:hypothetical protein
MKAQRPKPQKGGEIMERSEAKHPEAEPSTTAGPGIKDALF